MMLRAVREGLVQLHTIVNQMKEVLGIDPHQDLQPPRLKILRCIPEEVATDSEWTVE